MNFSMRLWDVMAHHLRPPLLWLTGWESHTSW